MPEAMPISGNRLLWDFVFTLIPSKSPSTLSMTRSCVVIPSLDNNLWHFISLIIYLLIIIWYTFTINTSDAYPFKNLTYSLRELEEKNISKIGCRNFTDIENVL